MVMSSGTWMKAELSAPNWLSEEAEPVEERSIPAIEYASIRVCKRSMYPSQSLGAASSSSSAASIQEVVSQLPFLLGSV